MDTVRKILTAELRAVIDEHAATPARMTAKRVALSRARKDLEREIEEYDRAFGDRLRRWTA